jgi:hypothetical protein
MVQIMDFGGANIFFFHVKPSVINSSNKNLGKIGSIID